MSELVMQIAGIIVGFISTVVSGIVLLVIQNFIKKQNEMMRMIEEVEEKTYKKIDELQHDMVDFRILVIQDFATKKDLTAVQNSEVSKHEQIWEKINSALLTIAKHDTEIRMMGDRNDFKTK